MGQVGVSQAGHDNSFALKLASVFICQEQVFLNGNLCIKVLVQCLIDRTHPALTKHSLDEISLIEDASNF
ncbi:MAG: hypothetical protein BWY72_02436 [Bacteroidetes bacterium ADurb.Bin416]|nr:MAG: hypothetical protein BWY72_02436 [Bacteroidetes bacterium ADurb.Bin416]